MAESCPHCGAPVKQQANQTKHFSTLVSEKAKLEKKSLSKPEVIVGLIFGLIGIVIAANKYPSKTLLPSADVSNEPPITISAFTFIGDYEKNEIAANNKYKNKRIVMQAAIRDIHQDGSQIYLDLSWPASDVGNIRAYLADNQDKIATQLSSGELIQIDCVGANKSTYPTLNACSVSRQNLTLDEIVADADKNNIS